MRSSGTARDDEELELGVRCMAAGIFDDQGKLVAGLSISAPADRLEEAWLERLKATAAQISAALGHRDLRRVGAELPAADRAASSSTARRPVRPAPAADSLDPAAHALGVADARVLAGRIEEHHDQLAARPCLACITRQRPASEM